MSRFFFISSSVVSASYDNNTWTVNVKNNLTGRTFEGKAENYNMRDLAMTRAYLQMTGVSILEAPCISAYVYKDKDHVPSHLIESNDQKELPDIWFSISCVSRANEVISVEMRDEATYAIFRGEATCNPKDPSSIALGREVAKKRALLKLVTALRQVDLLSNQPIDDCSDWEQLRKEMLALQRDTRLMMISNIDSIDSIDESLNENKEFLQKRTAEDKNSDSQNTFWLGLFGSIGITAFVILMIVLACCL